MKIAICGSMKLKARMYEIESKLKELGHFVYLPNMDEVNDYSVMSKDDQASWKNRMITDHAAKIKDSDAIFVANDRLKEIDGYIGANTFLEIGMAFVLGKKIFLLNDVPNQSNTVEILGLLPIVIGSDFSIIQ